MGILLSTHRALLGEARTSDVRRGCGRKNGEPVEIPTIPEAGTAWIFDGKMAAPAQIGRVDRVPLHGQLASLTLTSASAYRRAQLRPLPRQKTKDHDPQSKP